MSSWRRATNDRPRDPKSLTNPAQRVALLVEAGAILGSIDYETSLAKLGRLIVPVLADWWAVDILEADGGLRRIAGLDTREPGLARHYPPWPEAPSGPFGVLRTRRPHYLARVTDAGELALSPRPEHIEALRRLGARTAVFVPMLYQGDIVGALTFARTAQDISAHHVAIMRTLGHRIGQAVANGRLYQEVRDASRKKDEFLAMLGHELRNPLGAISNAVAILQSGKLPRDDEAPIHAILGRQVRHLRKLVDDLLDVARLTAGKIALHPVPIDLRTVAKRCLATIRGAGRGESHDIAIEGGSAMVLGDPIRLEQVLDNLLDNAMKHTPPGGQIRISVEARERDAILIVRDTGDGISSELLPHVFELFTQAPQGAHRPAGGLGLGLAVVKAIVELHAGSVHAKSPGPGGGAEITVRLPLAPALGTTKPMVESPAPPTRHYRILVVEDNEDARETLRILLELNGHQVELAIDGLTGLDLALRMRPDVVLIDLGLPGLDGYGLARRLREAPEGEGIRLIAVTGYGQPEDRHRASEAGFESFLVKPVDRRALEGAIHQT